MIAVKKPTGRAMSIPAGLAVGAAISGLITLLGCLILTWMVLKGSMVFEFIGYGIMILLLLGAFLGAAVAQGRVKHRRSMVCMLSGLVYFLILLAITALFFGGQYSGIGVTALLILAGAGTAALIFGKGRRPSGPKIRKAR